QRSKKTGAHRDSSSGRRCGGNVGRRQCVCCECCQNNATASRDIPSRTSESESQIAHSWVSRWMHRLRILLVLIRWQVGCLYRWLVQCQCCWIGKVPGCERCNTRGERPNVLAR